MTQIQKLYRQTGNTGKMGPDTIKLEQSYWRFADNILDTILGSLFMYLSKILLSFFL